MEVRRSRLGLALVQGVLLALCAASALVFAAWLLGYNGLGLVDGAVMSDRLEQTPQAGAKHRCRVRFHGLHLQASRSTLST